MDIDVGRAAESAKNHASTRSQEAASELSHSKASTPLPAKKCVWKLGMSPI